MERKDSDSFFENSINMDKPLKNDNNNEIYPDKKERDFVEIKPIISLTIGSSYTLGSSAKLQNIWYLNMQRALLNIFSENIDSKQINYRCDILTNAQGFAIDISSRFGFLLSENSSLNPEKENFDSRNNSQVLNAVYNGLCHTTYVNLPVILYNHKNDLIKRFQEIEKEFNCHITVDIRDKEKIQFYSKAQKPTRNSDLNISQYEKGFDQIENTQEFFASKMDIVITGLANEVAFSRLKIIRFIESYFNKELQYCENTQIFHPDKLKDNYKNMEDVDYIPKEQSTSLKDNSLCVDSIDESAKSVMNTIYYSTFVNNPVCLYSHWKPLPFFYRKTIWVNTYKLFFIFLFHKEQLEEILAKMQCCLVVGNILDASSELRIFSKVLELGCFFESDSLIEDKSAMIFKNEDYKRESQLLNSLLSQIMSLFESVLRLAIPLSENKERMFYFCFLGLNHISLTKNQEMVCFLHRDSISTALDKIVEFYNQECNSSGPSNTKFERTVSNQEEMSLQLVLNHSLADFLCGKKNGKINRIIKETNVKIIVQHEKDASYQHSKSHTQQQSYNISREQSDIGMINDSSSSNNSSEKNIFIDRTFNTSECNHLDANASFVTLFSNSADDLKIALNLLLLEFPSSLTFFLPEKYHKRIIGFGGKNIQRIMKKHGVYIKFYSEWEQSRSLLENDFCRYDIKYLGRENHRVSSISRADRSTTKTMNFESRQCSIGNVVIKTPQKNRKSLILMKREILSLVDDEYFDKPSRVYKMHPFEYFRFTHSQGNIRIGWNEVVCEDAKLWIESGGQFISYKSCDLDIPIDDEKSCGYEVVSYEKSHTVGDKEHSGLTSEQDFQYKTVSFDTEHELERSIENNNCSIEQISPENQHIATQVDDSSKKSGRLDYISDDFDDSNIISENKYLFPIEQEVSVEDPAENVNREITDLNASEKETVENRLVSNRSLSHEMPQIIIREHRHIFSEQLRSRQIIYQLIFDDQVDLTHEDNVKWLFPIYYKINDQTKTIGHQINLSDGTKFIRSLSKHKDVHQIINSSKQKNDNSDNLKRYEITAMSWRSTDLTVFPSKLFTIYQQNEKIDNKQSWWCVGTFFDTNQKRDTKK